MLAQYVDAYGRPRDGSDPENTGTDSLRDHYMAENIERLLSAEAAGTRMAVWAHNAHISAGDEGGRSKHMGWHLRRAYGDAYYAIGFSFNQGSFQARDLDPKTNRGLTEFKVGPAPEKSVDWYLARPGIKNYFIDLRRTTKSDVIEEWLNTPHRMRSIGSGYSGVGDNSYFTPANLRREFDGMVFVEATTRARPNPPVVTGSR